MELLAGIAERMESEPRFISDDEVRAFTAALLTSNPASKEIKQTLAPKFQILMKIEDGDQWCRDFDLPLEEMREVFQEPDDCRSPPQFVNDSWEAMDEASPLENARRFMRNENGRSCGTGIKTAGFW